MCISSKYTRHHNCSL